MNREDIIRMAREAGFNEFTGGLRDDGSQDTYLDCWPEQLERFFHMAQAAEREACSKLADEADKYNRHISREIAAAIRARGQTEKQQIQSSVREAIDEFGPERFAKAHAEPVQGHDWQERLKELQIVFKDVDQSGPLLGMGGKKIGCVNHDCDKCQAIKQAEKQKPMFWYRPRSDGMYEGPLHNKQIEQVRRESGGWVPLYTTPLNPTDSIKSSKTLDAQPHRQWIGLTDEEIDQIPYQADYNDLHMIARAVEAKLKEKNT